MAVAICSAGHNRFFCDHRKFRRLPSRNAARQLDQIRQTMLAQNARGNRRPIASRTMHRRRPAGISAIRSCNCERGTLKLSFRCFWFHSRGVRISTTRGRIRRLKLLGQHRRTHAFGRPGRDPAGRLENPCHLSSGPSPGRSRSFPGAIAASSSRPGSAMITIGALVSSTVPAHVAYCPPRPIDASGKMALGILRRIAHVENLRTGLSKFENFPQLHRMMTLPKSRLKRGPFASIQNRVISEVSRSVRLISSNDLHEIVLRHRL